MNTARATAQPNILIVVVDSMRADHVGCYGYKRDTTPTIDALAADGCRFDRAITAAPFSPASYASMMSNLYPHQHGVNGDTVRVWPDAMPRLPELLKAQGYTTFCLSNNSFVSQDTNAVRGFDTFLDWRHSRSLRLKQKLSRRLRMHLGETTAKRLSNSLHCLAKGDSEQTMRNAARIIAAARQPWFGFIILMDPHMPYSNRRLRYTQRTPAVRRFFAESNDRTLCADLMADNTGLSDEFRSVANDLYDGEIRFSDQCVGQLIDDVKRLGQFDNTLLAVTADHGEAFGEQEVWGHGFCLTDCLTRVPLIMRHPESFPAGGVCDAVVQLHDLHDTCMHAAGVKSCEQSLTQAADPYWPGREHAFTEFPRQSKTLKYMHDRNPGFQPGRWDHDMWAVRSREWRYVEYDGYGVELFDLASDPGETTSVHAGHADRCHDMAQILAAHRDDQPYEPAGDGSDQQMDEVVVERLRSLGYID